MLPVGDSVDERHRARMLARARLNPELPALIARGPVVVEGHGLVADVISRQLAREPGVTVHRWPSDAAEERTVPPDATTVVVLSASCVEVREAGRSPRRVRPEFVSAHELDRALARAADGQADALPDSVAWNSLAARAVPSADENGVLIGIGENGPVSLDLVHAGPHALIGGTTGSGKSELLRAVALGWAASSPPSAAQLLFIDFKGGATFATLTDLPHAIGLVTDLDPLVAQRAVRSLRAELRHREHVLTEAGVRDLREQPSVLPRLLVLVDEFATLVAAFPELHAVFADVAARGRSLGMHLVLCTQHPASIVRDAIAANCPVRMSFRVTEAASGSIIGDRARELVAAPPGRAVLTDEHGSRMLQGAVVGDDDIATVLERWRGHPPSGSTWCAPLPDRVDARELRSSDSAGGVAAHTSDERRIDTIAFGLLDDPDERRRRHALWSPPRDGSLAVLGGPRSGRTTLLATLAAGRPSLTPIVVLPNSFAEAWPVLERLAARPPEGALLVCDGLDAVLAGAGDRANELLSRWDAAARAVRSRHGAVVASLSASSAAGSLLVGRFESRVILRCSDADEHAVCGAPRGLFDRAAPPGRGWWCDLHLQVATSDASLPPPEPAPAREWSPGADQDAIVIAGHAGEVAQRIARSGSGHRLLTDLTQLDTASIDPVGSVATAPRLMMASPSEWQSAWSLLTAARARTTIALVGVDPSEVRTLLGHRDALPPIDVEHGEFWLAEPGVPVVRARWPALDHEAG